MGGNHGPTMAKLTDTPSVRSGLRCSKSMESDGLNLIVSVALAGVAIVLIATLAQWLQRRRGK